jgi:hypothetical protein
MEAPEVTDEVDGSPEAIALCCFVENQCVHRRQTRVNFEKRNLVLTFVNDLKRVSE